ncbi:unnamed protein product [Trichogramma brassicae]|uniref:Uncharacterized protein n=1 Tax=Trichogramma brassicae TaxID=86971 RepID=A0A6H5I395_9HYME|nr:unnamed protein product [Trichogramma brassicae]
MLLHPTVRYVCSTRWARSSRELYADAWRCTRRSRTTSRIISTDFGEEDRPTTPSSPSPLRPVRRSEAQGAAASTAPSSPSTFETRSTRRGGTTSSPRSSEFARPSTCRRSSTAISRPECWNMTPMMDRSPAVSRLAFLRARSSVRTFSFPASFATLCTVGLCELVLNSFFRRWAWYLLWKLTRYQLPNLCCDMVNKQLMIEDLYYILLAVAGQTENSKKKKVDHSNDYLNVSLDKMRKMDEIQHYGKFLHHEMPCVCSKEATARVRNLRAPHRPAISHLTLCTTTNKDSCPILFFIQLVQPIERKLRFDYGSKGKVSGHRAAAKPAWILTYKKERTKGSQDKTASGCIGLTPKSGSYTLTYAATPQSSRRRLLCDAPNIDIDVYKCARVGQHDSCPRGEMRSGRKTAKKSLSFWDGDQTVSDLVSAKST